MCSVEVDQMCVSVIWCRVGDAGCQTDVKLTGSVPEAWDKLRTLTRQRFSYNRFGVDSFDSLSLQIHWIRQALYSVVNN